MNDYERIFSVMTLLIQVDNTTKKARVKIIDYERAKPKKSLKKASGRLFK